MCYENIIGWLLNAVLNRGGLVKDPSFTRPFISVRSRISRVSEACRLTSRVHVVFGSVISGFEVIKKIEFLKTDSSSRPYADARVIDCGQLITKSANDGKRATPIISM